MRAPPRDAGTPACPSALSAGAGPPGTLGGSTPAEGARGPALRPDGRGLNRYNLLEQSSRPATWGWWRTTMGKPYSEPSRGVIAEIELLIEKSVRMLAEGLRAESLTVQARKDD